MFLYLAKQPKFLQLHCNKSLFSFSGVSSYQQKIFDNHSKFQSKYQENLKSFQDKMADLKKVQNPTEAPSWTPYQHPFDDKHHPITFSPIKNAELFFDFVGPEQVSPHYENYLVARKVLTFSQVGAILLIFGATSVDLHWMAKSAYIPFVFWLTVHYYYLEGRKSMFAPLLTRFYRQVAANEMYLEEAHYHENISIRIREILNMAKSQLEYGEVHQGYNQIKAQLINTFMLNEQLNLQKHVTDRTLSILKQAETYEKLNQQRLLQGIIDSALKELETKVSQQDPQILDAIFQSAIQGMSLGKMEYKNDPLLDLVLVTIRENVQKIQGLTEEEQTKLVQLSQDQLQSIRNSDQRAKETFLKAEPKIDASLKNSEVIKKQLATWGQ